MHAYVNQTISSTSMRATSVKSIVHELITGHQMKGQNVYMDVCMIEINLKEFPVTSRM